MPKAQNTKKTEPKTQKASSKNASPDLKEETKDLFADINVTMKSGHLTKDPDIVGDGKYVKVRIASNKEYEVDGEIKTNTNYFNILVSSNLDEVFELTKSFKKGDWTYFKGEDSTKSFDTAEGYKQTASTIFAYHAFLKKAKDSQPVNDNENTAEQSNNLQVVPA